MIYIFTGCDRTGKTTLANALIQKINAPYIHFSAPKSLQDGKNQYYEFINSLTNQDYVLDRFYECEDVYAPIYRNYSLDYLNEIEEKLKQHDVMFIYIYASISTIYERIKKCGENFLQENDIPKILDNYLLFFKKTKIPYIMLSGEYNDINVPINLILDKAKQLQKMRQYANIEYSYGNLLSDFITINLDNDSNVRDIDDLAYSWISNINNYALDASVLNKYEFIYHRKELL